MYQRLTLSSAAEGPCAFAAAAAAAAISRTSRLCSASDRWRRRRSRAWISSANGASMSGGTSGVMSSSPSWNAPVLGHVGLFSTSHKRREVGQRYAVSHLRIQGRWCRHQEQWLGISGLSNGGSQHHHRPRIRSSPVSNACVHRRRRRRCGICRSAFDPCYWLDPASL